MVYNDRSVRISITSGSLSAEPVMKPRTTQAKGHETETAAGRRRPRPRGRATREHVLEVAIDLFASRGFDGVSIRDIAAITGATLPTIYYHFGDKRSLYLEACLRLFSAWGHRREHFFEQGSPAEQRLFDYLLSVVESLTSDRKFSGLMQREILERDIKGIRRLTEAIFSKHFSEVAKLCRQIGCKGDPALAAHTVYALVFGLAQLRPIGHELGTTQAIDSSEALIRHVLGVVLPAGKWSRIARNRSSAGA
jgi:AcrR family transcriptional regulator